MPSLTVLMEVFPQAAVDAGFDTHRVLPPLHTTAPASGAT